MAVMSWAEEAPEFIEDGFLSSGPVTIQDLLHIDDMLVPWSPTYYASATTLSAEKKSVFARVERMLKVQSLLGSGAPSPRGGRGTRRARSATARSSRSAGTTGSGR